MASSRQIKRIAEKYGHQLDSLARQRYGVSGATLIAKTVKGESGGRGNAVSSAGARGYGQFMPGTRQAVLAKTGGKVDPWRSLDEAVRGMVMHMTGKLGNAKGLEGYNPGGGQGYVKYILGQDVGHLKSRGGKGGGGRGGAGSTGRARTSSRVRGEYGIQPGVDNSALRQQIKLDYLDKRGKPGALLDLKTQLDQAVDVDPKRIRTGTTRDTTTTRNGGRSASGGGRDLGGGKPTKGGKVIGTPHSGTHTLGNWQSDNAVDIRIPNGKRIFAVGDGVVEKVKGSYNGGSSRFDGYQVTIRTKNNEVFYTHLSRASVKPGQRVKRGQTIGRSGSANGVPHLHMGVKNGDPRRYLK